MSKQLLAFSKSLILSHYKFLRVIFLNFIVSVTLVFFSDKLDSYFAVIRDLSGWGIGGSYRLAGLMSFPRKLIPVQRTCRMPSGGALFWGKLLTSQHALWERGGLFVMLCLSVSPFPLISTIMLYWCFSVLQICVLEYLIFYLDRNCDFCHLKWLVTRRRIQTHLSELSACIYFSYAFESRAGNMFIL